MVTYDLNKVKDYPKLYKALGELGEPKRDPGLDSVWFIQTNYSLIQVKNRLFANIDQDDRIFFCKFTNENCVGWLNEDVVAWINARAI